MNILSGVYHPDEGHIEFEGNIVKFRDPRHAQHTGNSHDPSRTFFISLHERRRKYLPGRMLTKSFGFIDRKKMVSECGEILNKPWGR
jgi:ABC-type sugar transport system ATPase subunit